MSGPMIAPSVLSADFGRLRDEVRAVTDAGADWIHVDVMDGHFVPPITIGPVVVRAIRAATELPLDVHLMVADPEPLLREFREAGAASMTVHVEACADVPEALRAIRATGAKAGLSLSPPTPLARVQPCLGLIHVSPVMAASPGWGDKPIVPGSMQRVADANAMRREAGGKFLIEIDGGIKAHNAREAVAAGADVLVSGSGVFGERD